MKLSLLFISGFIFFGQVSFAQGDPEAEMSAPSAGIEIKSNIIYGKLVDAAAGRPIEAGSVQLYIVQKNKKDSLIRGMLTLANGDFRFEDLPANYDFKLVITAISYKGNEQLIPLKTNSGTENRQRGNKDFFSKDLGNMVLQSEIQQLNEVTVLSTRPALEMGIDRKVFNVEKLITSAGGTAIDVIRTIPSVSVDIDGNVELRNSTPQIFIDGRPTILTLDQIPADNIEKIELITNPSAKFDAASSGGILNIILKKNKRIGLNGIASLGVGLPGIINSNLNLNLRQGKFNFFVSGGYNQSGGVAKGEAQRQNKENGLVKDYFNQYTRNERWRRFSSIRFGADYFIDNRNTIGIVQNFTNGRFTNDESQSQEYLNATGRMEYYGRRLATAKSRFDRNSTRINYKHNFPKAGKELTADITYENGDNNENSDIFNAFFYPNGAEYEPPSSVKNDGRSDNRQITFQTDFVNPQGEESKVEMGIRVYQNKFKSFFNAYSVNSGQLVKLPLSNNYEYTELINAAYFTYTDKKESWGYQFGLRAEHSKFDGVLIDSAYKFGYEYPNKISRIWDALFPGVYLTKQWSEEDEIQVNYSRRIRRPRFWQLNPFIEINDPVNLRQGNPQLRPEFINSFELNYSRNYQNGNFLAAVYFRNNPDDITQYSDTITAEQYQELNNAGVDPNAILNTFINASTTNRYGAEFTLQHKIGENFDVTPTFDFQYSRVKANIGDLDLSNDGFSWEAELVMNYKAIAKNKRSVFHELGFQLSGEYESREVIPQGMRQPEFSIDIALRKDFLKKNKGSLTFAVNDVFNSHRFGVIYDTEQFYQESFTRRNVRSLRITFSYKFGDADFSLLRRGGNRGGGDDDD